MKIVKPLSLGILQRPYRYRGQNRLALAALGFFRLGQEATDRFLTENLQWAKLVPILPLGQPLDHILSKSRAEIMLSGAAYAKDPVMAMTVRMQCGAIDKRLCVIGDRTWHRRLGPWVCVDEAKPFTRMPIVWENAYGGSAYAPNPLGRGFLSRLSWLSELSGAMPNIESVSCAPMPGRRRHAPAGFAPMNLIHSPARTRSGTYDARWLREDFPGLPQDFDFGLFNLAPVDQQFEGRFSGDEAYCLEGLHPSQDRLCGTLPGLAARAFVVREGQGAGQAEEVGLECDTVWFFPELDLGLLVYRGETSVEDSDALDIQAVMVAYERIVDTPRPLSHYRDVLALRLDPQTAGLHAFNEAQLAPSRSAEALEARAAARRKREAEQLAQRQSLLDEQMADFWSRNALTPPADYEPPRVSPPPFTGPSPEEIAEGEFDLSELHAQAQALAEAARRDGEARLAEGRSVLDRNSACKPSEAQVTVEEATRQALARAEQVAYDLNPATGSAPDPVPEPLREMLDEAERTGGLDEQEKAGIRASLARISVLKRASRNAAMTPSALSEALPDPAAKALREYVQTCLKSGHSLAGRNLAGADLSGLDLSGSDLREILLERANLKGSNLSGANLLGAVLTEAVLDGADFSAACLDGANLCGSRAQGSIFHGASLRGARAMDAVWPKADLRGAALDDFLAQGIVLTGANLDDTRLERTILVSAKAEMSSWRGASWNRVVATSAIFSDADFTQAGLKRSVLMDANLSGSNWAQSCLSCVYAGGRADWEKASLQGASFSRCGFHGAKLIGADLSKGIFAQTDFGEADLSEAKLEEARFYRSLFMRSRLRHVRAERADFFQAMCRKADFGNAILKEAVLVQVDMAEAQWQGADRQGCRVTRGGRL